MHHGSIYIRHLLQIPIRQNVSPSFESLGFQTVQWMGEQIVVFSETSMYRKAYLEFSTQY